MSKNKIGRNDPCPCGSGKKFKNCCLALDDADGTDLFTRYSQAITSVKLKLDQEFKSDIKRIRKSAQQNFLYYAASNQLPAEHESIFSDWLWFDMTDIEGNTMALDYLNQHADFMPDALQECLTALASSYLSVYEPGTSADGFMEVRDIFSNVTKKVILKEALDEDMSTRSYLLLGRLMALAEGNVFSGMVLAIDNNDGQEKYMIEHMHYLQQLENEPDIMALLKPHAELLYGLFDHAYHKKHILINDIRIMKLPEPVTYKSLQERLDAVAGLCFVHDLEDLRWYKAAEEQGFQRIACGTDYMVSCISSLDKLNSWQDILGDILPGINTWQIVNTRFLRKSPPADLVPVWFKVMRELETERWLHTPHGELADKTPLEQLAEENGLEKVINMLDLFAARLDEGNEGLDLIDYMRCRIAAMQEA